jgi:acetyltransferase-like isoleucine patch superfamily enzyme
MLQKILQRLRAHGLRLRGVRFESVPSLAGARPFIVNHGTLSLGSGVALRSFRSPISIHVARGGKLHIGTGAFVNDGVSIFCAQQVDIGPHTKIGNGVTIYDTDFHPATPEDKTAPRPVTIGRNVWIGARAMVLAGSRIGDHSVIAAGSIVRGDVPARSIAAGTPAQVVRTFECADDWVRP